MVRLVSMEDDPEEEGGLVLSLVPEEGEDAGELARLVQEQGVPWDAVEPADVPLAIRLQMYLSSENPPPTSIKILAEEGGEGAGEGGGAAGGAWGAGAGGDDYFSAYEDMGVHELMVRDQPRMEAFRAAMHANRHLMVGKVVLDVGTGTGVLAMFAAKAGARKVYAVEASGVADIAQRLVKANGLDGVVKVIKGRMEDVELPEKVDVIVSEWMGFYLLHETMLPSVLVARDRWLKEGGVMMPSACRLYGAPCSVYGGLAPGLDLSLLSGLAGPLPRIMTLAPERLASGAALLLNFSCGDVTAEGLAHFEADACVRAVRGMDVDGVCLWFECDFAVGGGAPMVVLRTGPSDPETHWKQTVVLLGATARVAAGEVMPFRVGLRQDPANPRRYELSVAT